jgi:hypothetical protein
VTTSGRTAKSANPANEEVSCAARNSRFAWAALVVLGQVALAGCGEPRPEFFATVHNDTDQDVEVWVRIETLRGDMKHNGPLVAPAHGEASLSMGRFQGTYRFTALLGDAARQDIESVLPKDDWVVEVHEGGEMCFRFGERGAGDERCG